MTNMVPVLNQMPSDTMSWKVNQANTAFNKLNPKASRARNVVMDAVRHTSLKKIHSNMHRDKPELAKIEAATVPIPYKLSQKSAADQESQTMQKCMLQIS